jgi:dienelactone hydrolase
VHREDRSAHKLEPDYAHARQRLAWSRTVAFFDEYLKR